jgi:deoxyhypusine synthase
MVDVIITTCGTLDHDLARSFKDYYHGDFFMDDVKLRKEGVHRLGNVLVPKESYGIIIEEKMRMILEDIYNRGYKDLSTHELIWFIGSFLNESSILYWAERNRIPIIVPGPYDGAVGYQIWLFQQFYKDFRLNLFRDESLLSDLVYEAKRSGGLIIGGGISKHHLLWWNQFRGGLDIALQVSTGVEFDGSLTGARLSEAITWGKIKPVGKEVSIWGEATVILPLLVKAVLESI